MEYVSSVGGVAGVISILIHIVDKILTSKCHKRFHSSCCKKDIDIDMAIDNGTPPSDKDATTTSWATARRDAIVEIPKD